MSGFNLEALEAAIDERDRLRAALADLAEHGTRHDTRPSLAVRGVAAVERLYEYIEGMDGYIRSFARQALGIDPPPAVVLIRGRRAVTSRAGGKARAKKRKRG